MTNNKNAAHPKTLPCPFCGSPNVSDGECLSEHDGAASTQSQCMECGALGPEAWMNDEEVDYGSDKARAAWNRRAAHPAIEDWLPMPPEATDEMVMAVRAGTIEVQSVQHQQEIVARIKSDYRKMFLAMHDPVAERALAHYHALATHPAPEDPGFVGAGDMSFEQAAMRAIEPKAVKLLRDLLSLKDRKDKQGKDEYYERQQPMLWARVREFIAYMDEPRNVEGMTRAEFEKHLRIGHQYDNGGGPLTAEQDRDVAERVERNYPIAGTFACPICGKDSPHQHSGEEIAKHRGARG